MGRIPVLDDGYDVEDNPANEEDALADEKRP
jgi:hypothetical protein